MRDYKLEQKYRKMIRRDKFLRVLVYVSMALVLGSVFLWKRFLYGGYGIFLGIVLFSLLVCVVHWQNLRCPRCGKLLTEYRASMRRVPAFCISCGLELRSLKTNEYDLQPPVRETVERPETTDELTAQCHAIARRDRVFRPLSWLALVLTIVVIFVHELRLLPSDVTLPMLVAVFIFLLVTSILWSRNLRCPACGRGLTGKYTKNRLSIFYLPRAHVCGHCDTRLPFRE